LPKRTIILKKKAKRPLRKQAKHKMNFTTMKAFSTLSIMVTLLSFAMMTSTVFAETRVIFAFKTPVGGVPATAAFEETLSELGSVSMMEYQAFQSDFQDYGKYAPDVFNGQTRQLRGSDNANDARRLPMCYGVSVPSSSSCTNCKTLMKNAGIGTTSAYTFCQLCDYCRRRSLAEYLFPSNTGPISFETTNDDPLAGLDCQEMDQAAVINEAASVPNFDPVASDFKVYVCAA
jgi:hypothetical protein